MKKNITIYDTTLRDGAQTVGISFSLQDKLGIAAALDRLTVDYIEGGWPGSNPKDDQFFAEIRKVPLQHAKIAAFGSTRRPKHTCAGDPLLQALLDAETGVITIVAKTWDFHVTHALKISLQENLAMIYDTVAYLKDKGRTVFLDAEHAFDAFKHNRDYTLEALGQAARAGADQLVLCDTNGGTLPHEVQEIVTQVGAALTTPLGVHFHDDGGMAVANSATSVLAGAVSVQGTANGYGERCGNCNLMTLIPVLALKLGYPFGAAGSLTHLTEVSGYISEIANLARNPHAPFVGDNAFAHKGGIHVSALQKDSRTYEHIDPALVGNRRKVLVSELSGKSNIEFKAREFGIDLDAGTTLPADVLKKIKRLEDEGFQFEAAEGSFELLMREATGEYRPFFTLKGFRVITEMKENQQLICEATIKVEVDNCVAHTAANGNGPVDALDNALRKALTNFYPQISQIRLTDYKVRVLDEKSGTGSVVRVLIEHAQESEHWSTVGVSANIIEASWQALVDGIEYMLFKQKKP